MFVQPTTILRDYTSHTTTQIFHLIAEEDEAAYRELFQRYFYRLYSVMLQFTKKAADAEDIVQSLFMKIWEKRGSLAEVEDPENWLFITARNEFLNRFRKLRLEERYRHYLTQVFAEEAGTPEQLVITKQKEEAIRNAIRALPEKQQQAFLLSREEGLTYEEIAVRLGVAKSTIKEHISRALRTIRVSLQHSEDSADQQQLMIFLLIFFESLSPFFSI